MSTPAKKSATTCIPVPLSATEFKAFILPHLSMPRRGSRCKLGYHRVFNLILWVLYTGMQRKCLPVPKAPDGTDAIHYTTVYKVFARRSDDGSHEHALVANAGLIPNIKENPRKRPKRGRQRLFNQVIHDVRDRVERTFVWEAVQCDLQLATSSFGVLMTGSMIQRRRIGRSLQTLSVRSRYATG